MVDRDWDKSRVIRSRFKARGMTWLSYARRDIRDQACSYYLGIRTYRLFEVLKVLWRTEQAEANQH